MSSSTSSTTATSPNYSRVPQQEGGGGTDGGVSSNSSNGSNLILRSRTERLQDKGVAVCWVVLAYVVARWSNFFSYVLWGINKTRTPDTGSTAAVGSSDVDANLTVLRLALVGFSVVTMLGLYLTVYLPRVKGLPLKDSASWAPVYCPTVIPSMAVTFAISFILLIRSVWPIYGFLSPIIASAQLIALFMSTHLIPTFGLC